MPTLRTAFASTLLVLAMPACAGVITQDGVVFTSTYTGNVLTLEIDAAGRSGGWAAATALDSLAIKTIGGFSGVTMTSSNGGNWSLSNTELKASGCGAASTAAAGTSFSRLCYAGTPVALADNMVFTFTFDGSPNLSAPHLKVHFVNARGSKTGSLLSMDFPYQAASSPAGTGSGASSGSGGDSTSLIPAPVLTEAGKAAELAPADLPALGETDAAIPEPRTMALLTAGLVMLAVARRRRK
jgi:hypothetical protein